MQDRACILALHVYMIRLILWQNVIHDDGRMKCITIYVCIYLPIGMFYLKKRHFMRLYSNINDPHGCLCFYWVESYTSMCKAWSFLTVLHTIYIHSVSGDAPPVGCCSNSRCCPGCWAPQMAPMYPSYQTTGEGQERQDMEKDWAPPDHSCCTVETTI